MNELPNEFKLNKPILSSITNLGSRNVFKSSNKSLLWSPHLKSNVKLEIINCKSGINVNGCASSVCKYQIFKEWLATYLLIVELQKSHGTFINISDISSLKTLIELNKNEFSYNDLKLLAEDYQNAKLKVYGAFEKKNLGSWITKPFEQDHFIINKP